MNKVSKAIAQSRMLILVIAFLLLIPSVLGYLKTDVNYDILGYLPDELDTRIAQSILKDDFEMIYYIQLKKQGKKETTENE